MNKMMFQSVFISIVILLFVNVSHAFKIPTLNLMENIPGSNLSDNPAIVDQISSGISKVKSQTLNCFGIPVALFANVVEKLFTQQTKAEDVRFYFYSRDIPENVTVRSNEDFNVKDLPYKHNRKTVIITHGFMASGTQDWVQEMKDAFLKLDDVNVIAVDWQKGSNTWNYISASISTKIVGAEIAKLLQLLKAKTLAISPGIKELSPLHLVGHSLGSHISAHASYVTKELDKNQTTKFTVERITGLDPAQPCFKTADASLKLEQSDAEYVDVIHTNAQNILLLGLGLPEQLGDADYYPNGGKIQLGCAKINPKIWDFLLLPVDIVKSAICSHGRSHELLTDSINAKISNACHFQGHPWNKKYENLTALVKPGCDYDQCAEMGINSIKYHPDKDGTYFVPTTADPLYCNVSDLDRNNIQKQLERQEKSLVTKVADHIVQ